MDCNKCEDLAEVKEKVNTLCDRDRSRGDRGRDRECNDNNTLVCTKGIDSSLLFFFLLLVIIVEQYNCDIEFNSLLWFFLLLVVLLNGNMK